MNRDNWIEKTSRSATTAERSSALWNRFRTCCLARGLPMWLALALPTTVFAQYEYTQNGGGLTLTRYTGTGGAVYIPASIDGQPVTGIGDYAFSAVSSLTSVSIPQGVTAIGSYAFNSCDNLTQISLPASVSSIGTRAFVLCPRLSTIGIHAANPVFGTTSGALFNKQTSTLLHCPAQKSGNFVVPNGIIRIETMAFGWCTALTGVTFPTSLVRIDDDAFIGCRRLSTIALPASVTSLGETVFNACPMLTAIHVDANNPAYRSLSGILYNKAATALIHCPMGKSGFFTPPASVASLEVGALSGTKFSKVTLPDGVAIIRPYVFQYCQRLTNVMVGRGTFHIGSRGFAYCTNLAGVYFLGNAPTLEGSEVFTGCTSRVYFSPGTTGWGATYGGRPTSPFVFLSIAPTSRTYFRFAAAAQTVAVTASIAWTATANQPWITITSGGAGMGNGTVTYDLQANAGTARSGRITVTGGGVSRILTVNQFGAGGDDPYESDNSAGSARAIANGEIQIRSIHAAGNADWIKFTVGGIGAQNLRLETSGSNGDSEMWLYRGNGSLVAYDDNSGNGNFSLITAPALTPGTYYLKIQEFGNNGIIPAFWIRATWTAMSIAPDAYESDDSASAAKGIGNGQTQTRSIHAQRNVDWVKVTVGGSGARNFRLETSGASGDTQLWIFRGSGALVAYDDNAGTGDFSLITVPWMAPGTYYIKVQENGNNWVIPSYTLRAGWTAP